MCFMKRYLLLVKAIAFGICFVALSSSAFAQVKAKETTVLKLGKRTVRVPAPSGFVEGAERFADLKSRFSVTESPGNEMLAVLLPESIVPLLEKGEIPRFDEWAKISILKTIKEIDVDAASFKDFAEKFEKMTPQLIDEKNPTFKNAVSNARKGLNDLLGNDTVMDISQPKSLGTFDRKADTHSTLIVVTLKDALGSRLLLGTLTLLRVNQRLLFVYTYHEYTKDDDPERVRNFSKKWTTDILAANK